MRVLRESIPIFMLLAAPAAAAVRGERRRLQVITREQCQGEELEFVSQGCSTAEACEAAALEMGLELGSDEWDFAGNYADKGCIYYAANHPEYPNQAYFGEGWGHCGELRTIPMANGIRINCNGGEGTTTTTTTEIFDPMLCQGDGLCRTMQDCRRAAQLQGYQLGSELEPFAGEYYVKGCVFYPDDHPEYPGQSYWGAGASFCGQLRADPFEYDGSQRLSCDGVGPPQEVPQPDDQLLGSTGGGGGGGSQSQGENTGGQQQQGGGGGQGQNTGGQQQGGGGGSQQQGGQQQGGSGGSQSQGQNTGGQQQQGSTGGGGTEAQNQGQNTGGQQQTGTGGFGSTENQEQQTGGQQQQTGTGGFGSTDNQGQQTGGGQQQQTEGGGGGQSQQEVNQQEPRPNAEDAQQGQITGGEPQQQLETGTTGGGQGQTTGQAQQGQAGAGTQDGQGAGGTAPVERPAEAPGQSPLGPQATADGKKEDDDGDEEDKKQDDEKEEDQKEDEKEDTKDDGDDNDLDQFTVSAIEGQQATSDGNALGGRMQIMLQAAVLAVMWFGV